MFRGRSSCCPPRAASILVPPLRTRAVVVYHKEGKAFMNNPPPPNPLEVQFQPFHWVHAIRVNVHIDRKIFFQQRIVFLFGAAKLREILVSPNPIILPIIDYSVSFDVHIFILF